MGEIYKAFAFADLDQKTRRQQEVAEDVSRETKLESNFPKPYNPVTAIKYSIAEDIHVVLKVYDILGQEAATLINGIQPAGYKDMAQWVGLSLEKPARFGGRRRAPAAS